MSFLSVIADWSLVDGGDVTTTLFVRVVGGVRRLGRCVVGTGTAVIEGGAEIILLRGAFISVALAPLGVANRRASGGVHTHASIVHSSPAANTLDVRHAVVTRHSLFVVVDRARRCWHCYGKTTGPAARTERSLILFTAACHSHGSQDVLPAMLATRYTPTALREHSSVPHINRQ